jgi:hypothetical protein
MSAVAAREKDMKPLTAILTSSAGLSTEKSRKMLSFHELHSTGFISPTHENLS